MSKSPQLFFKNFLVSFTLIFLILKMFEVVAYVNMTFGMLNFFGSLFEQLNAGLLSIFNIEYVNLTSDSRAKSGDRAINYSYFIFSILISLIGASIWSFSSKKEPNKMLVQFLYIGVRYFLAVFMIFYGMNKVIPNQFSIPGLSYLRLTEEYGMSGSMGLAWTFLGKSHAYSVFGGAAEVVGAILLLFRRTTLIGALIVAGVMLNVFVINLFFAVPVKIFSFTLLLLATGLILIHAKAVVNFFWNQKMTQVKPLSAPWENWPRRWIIYSFKSILIVLVFLLAISSNLHTWERINRVHPVSGIYMPVEYITGENDTLSVQYLPWSRLIIDNKSHHLLALDYHDRRRGLYSISHFGEKPQFQGSLFALQGLTIPEIESTLIESLYFSWEKSPSGKLILSGLLDDLPVKITLRSIDPGELFIMQDSFRFVLEKPNDLLIHNR